MDGLRRRRAGEPGRNDRHDPRDIGQWMQSGAPEVKGFSQSALQLVGRHQSGQHFFTAAPLLLGKGMKRRGAIAKMTRGAAAAQHENIIGIQIANHGAVDQHG